MEAQARAYAEAVKRREAVEEQLKAAQDKLLLAEQTAVELHSDLLDFFEFLLELLSL